MSWNTKSRRIFSSLGQNVDTCNSSDLGLNSQKFLMVKGSTVFSSSISSLCTPSILLALFAIFSEFINPFLIRSNISFLDLKIDSESQLKGQCSIHSRHLQFSIIFKHPLPLIFVPCISNTPRFLHLEISSAEESPILLEPFKDSSLNLGQCSARFVTILSTPM